MLFVGACVLLMGHQCRCGQTSAEQPISATEEYYRDSVIPLDAMIIIGFGCLGLAIAIATMGGVGGNSLIIPICLICFRFTPSATVAHSTLFVLVASIFQLSHDLLKTKDHKTSKFSSGINFDLLLLAAPFCILGSFIGVALNQISPDALSLIFFIAVSLLVLFVTIIRFCDSKENEKILEKGPIETDPQLGGQDELAEMEPSAKSECSIQKPLETLHPDQERESLIGTKPNRVIDNFTVFFIIGLMLLTPIFEVLRGSKRRDSFIGIQRCSRWDIVLTFGYPCLLLVLAAIAQIYVKSKKRSHLLFATSSRIAATNFQIAVCAVCALGSYIALGSTTMILLTLTAFGQNYFVSSSTGFVITVMFTFSASLSYYFQGFIDPTCAIIGGVIVLCTAVVTKFTLFNYYFSLGKASVPQIFIMGITIL